MANRFNVQLSTLEGVSVRARALISQCEEQIARNNAENKKLLNTIQEQNALVESNRLAIEILEVEN